MRRKFNLHKERSRALIALCPLDDTGSVPCVSFCPRPLAMALGISVNSLMRRKKLVVDLLDGHVPRGYRRIRLDRYAAEVRFGGYGRSVGIEFESFLGFTPDHDFIGVKVLRQ